MSATCPEVDAPVMAELSCGSYKMSGMTTTAPRAPKPPKLMGAAEAAKYLGVHQQNLRPIPGLPAPVQTLRCGSIWLADDIKAFARRRKRVNSRSPRR